MSRFPDGLNLVFACGVRWVCRKLSILVLLTLHMLAAISYAADCPSLSEADRVRFAEDRAAVEKVVEGYLKLEWEGEGGARAEHVSWKPVYEEFHVEPVKYYRDIAIANGYHIVDICPDKSSKNYVATVEIDLLAILEMPEGETSIGKYTNKDNVEEDPRKEFLREIKPTYSDKRKILVPKNRTYRFKLIIEKQKNDKWFIVNGMIFREMYCGTQKCLDRYRADEHKKINEIALKIINLEKEIKIEKNLKKIKNYEASISVFLLNLDICLNRIFLIDSINDLRINNN